MLTFTLTPRTLHFAKPARTARGALTERVVWLVAARESTRPEIIGWGECGPIPGLSVDDSRSFPRQIQSAVERLNAAALELPAQVNTLESIEDLLRTFATELRLLPSLRFGLETALLDLSHGGQGLLFPSPWTRGEALLPTHGLIWIDTPEGILAQVRAKVAAGFAAIKMKVGALEGEDEWALLYAIRQEFPQIALRLDANGAMQPYGLLGKLERLAALAPEYLEQPLPPGRMPAHAPALHASPVPIALDESLIGVSLPHERRALLDELRPRHIILKPALLGGFAACVDWIVAAEERGIQWWANSLLESAVGHNAVCQWSAALGGERVHGLGTGSLFTDNLSSPVRLEGSHLRWVGRGGAIS